MTSIRWFFSALTIGAAQSTQRKALREIPKLSDKRMKDINRELLQTFVAKKRKAFSTKTVRNLVALLSMRANGDNRGRVSDSENLH